MTEFVLQTGALFPEGTELGAYRNQPSGASRPVGTADATATVSAGEASFTGLTAGQFYRAMGEVEGEWRSKSFWSDDPAADEHTDSNELAAAIELHRADTTDIHGIADTADLVTLEEVEAAAPPIFYVENYYDDSDPEGYEDANAIMRAAAAAYEGVGDFVSDPVAELNYGFGKVVFHGSKEYVVPTDELVFDISRASFIGGRGTRIRTEDTEGTLIEVTATTNRVEGPNSFGGAGAVVKDLYVKGDVDLDDDPPNYDLIGWDVTSLDASGDVAHVTFDGIRTRGFSTGWQTGDNAHQVVWTRCLTNFCIFGYAAPYGATNTGERMSWFGSLFAANCVHIINYNASIHLYGCSLDYTHPGGRPDTSAGIVDNPKQRAIQCGAGSVSMHGGHIEDNNDSDYWISTQRPDAFVSLNGVALYVTGSKADYELFYSGSYDDSAEQDEVSHLAGISMDGSTLLHFSPSVTYTLLTLHAGHGRFAMNGAPGMELLTSLGSITPIGVAPSLALNTFKNDAEDALDQFENLSTDAGCVTYDSGSDSIKFQTLSNGQTCQLRRDVLIQPGQVAFVACRRKYPAVARNWLFALEMLDEDDAAIPVTGAASYTWHQSTVAADFIVARTAPMLAPPGAVKARLTITLPTAATTEVGYLKDAVFTVV